MAQGAAPLRAPVRGLRLVEHRLLELLLGFAVVIVSFVWLFRNEPAGACVIGIAAGLLLVTLGIGLGGRRPESRTALSGHVSLDGLAIAALVIAALAALLGSAPGVAALFAAAAAAQAILRATTRYTRGER